MLLGIGIYRYNQNLTVIDIVINSTFPFILYQFIYRKNHNKVGFLNKIILSSLCLYLVFLFNYTQFYIPFIDINSINFTDIKYVNIIPLRTILNIDLFNHNLSNIFLFIPFGTLYSILRYKEYSFKTIISHCIILIVIIEITQFVFTNIFSYSSMSYNRIADIDDLILNLIGCSLGYLSFIVLKKVINRFQIKK